MKNSSFRSLLVSAISLLILNLSTSSAENPINDSVKGTLVCPRPAIELAGSDTVLLAEPGNPLTATVSADLREAAQVRSGLALLENRLRILGTTEIVEEPANGILVLEETGFSNLGAMLPMEGGSFPSPKRLQHGYSLLVEGEDVTLRAASPLGFYYGLVTLCQLVEKNAGGDVVCPQVYIIDAPAIDLRLAKTSASVNSPQKVRDFAAWFPLMKLNLIGLQYHGDNSKAPDDNFQTSVADFCRASRERGIFDVMVYFCPFRSAKGARANAYDFSLPEDREAYVELLTSFLARGARGIEIDYNDWPDQKGGTPIEEVINLAGEGIAKKYPDAIVLYCPPNKGSSQYRGPASPEMIRILSQVPEKVWPLWTGMKTLIEKPLTAEQVEAWTTAAGRRPFLWVNRVSLGAKHQFAREVPGQPGAWVFRGDYLPKNLDRLFEGVHFNAGISDGYMELTGEMTPDSLVFVATAADYVWNPHGWSPDGSWRRAKRFVEIMMPLLKPAAHTGHH